MRTNPDEHEETFRRLLWEHGPSERHRDVVPPAPGVELQELGPVVTDGTITTHDVEHDVDGLPSAVVETVERLGFTDSSAQ